MKTFIISISVACGILFVSSFAQAGQVRIVSDVWDYIPVVEFCTGLNAPQRCLRHDVVQGVERGYVYVGPEKVCYRRSADPYNANSVLNHWTCGTHLISGSWTYSLN